MSRIDKENYYLDIAETVLERSTCRRVRSGAIIVRNDEIVSKMCIRDRAEGAAPRLAAEKLPVALPMGWSM